MFQCFLYAADAKEKDTNFYALPLPISPVVSASSKEVIRIDIMPTGPDNAIKPIEKYTPRPSNEYLPEYQKLRTDLKPLNVVQPEGASFSVQEQGVGSSIIDWQKWHFRVGFNQREGMVLYDVREQLPFFRSSH
jgi:primary-amine oxidase